MFAFLSYNGNEPGWATALRESNFPGLSVYSPALPLDDQIEAIGDDLSARQPNALACTFSTAFRLEGTIGLPLPDALPTLMAADSCTVTSQLIYRDLYLLVRSDVLIVDAHSTNELAVYAFLLGIPVVAVSYGPSGLHPWLTHCAHTTVNSPESVQEILDAFTPTTPNISPPEAASRELTEAPPEHDDTIAAAQTACARHYVCQVKHVEDGQVSGGPIGQVSADSVYRGDVGRGCRGSIEGVSDCANEESEVVPTTYEYTCSKGHVFEESAERGVSVCIVEIEGMAECRSPVTMRPL